MSSNIEDLLNASDSDEEDHDYILNSHDMLENILASNSDDEDADEILSNIMMSSSHRMNMESASTGTSAGSSGVVKSSDISLDNVKKNASEGREQEAKSSDDESKPIINELFQALTKVDESASGNNKNSSKNKVKTLEELLMENEEDEDELSADTALAPTPEVSMDAKMKAMKLNIAGVVDDDEVEEQLKDHSSSGAMGQSRSVPPSTMNKSVEYGHESGFSYESSSFLQVSTELGNLDEAYRREKSFMMSGNRDVNTALIQQPSRSSSTSSHIGEHTSGVEKFSYVKIQDMELITQQLQRNAHYKQHGSGVATVVHSATHTNASGGYSGQQQQHHIYVGTSKGMVLVFDPKYALKTVIGSEIPFQSRCCAAVSSMDSVVLSISATTNPVEYLLVGYVTGEIALFDVHAGVLVKRITDIHTSRVVRIAIVRNVATAADSLSVHNPTPVKESRRSSTANMSALLSGGSGNNTNANVGASVTKNTPEIFAVSVDGKGVVHKLHLVKEHSGGLLGSWSSSSNVVSFSASTECLLDGAAGVITDLTVVPAFRSRTSHAIKGRMPAATVLPSNLQLICFNSLTRTYFVQVAPSIKVIHRVLAPDSIKEEISSAKNATSKMPPQAAFGRPALHANPSGIASPVVSIEWGWVQHRFLAPYIDSKSFDTLTTNPAPTGNTTGSQPQQQQVFHPVLARSWGRNVSLTVCLPKVPVMASTHGTGQDLSKTPPPPAALPAVFQFVTINEIEFSSTTSLSKDDTSPTTHATSSVIISPILCIRWLDNGEGLFVLTTMELLILKVPSLSVQERISLTPNMSNSFQVTLGNRTIEEAYPIHFAMCPIRGTRYLYVYVAAESALVSCYIQSWTEHMDKLIGESRWLEALSFALKSVTTNLSCGFSGQHNLMACGGSVRMKQVTAYRKTARENAIERRKSVILSSVQRHRQKLDQVAKRDQEQGTGQDVDSDEEGDIPVNMDYMAVFDTWQDKTDKMLSEEYFPSCPKGLSEDSSSGIGDADGSLQRLQQSQQFMEDTKLLDHYLRRYVDLALSQQSHSQHALQNMSPIQLQQRHQHFVRVAGVCIDYCLTINHLSLLFTGIYEKFVIMYQRHAFLEALEPFITTSRAIKQLPSQILHSFISLVTNSKSTGILPRRNQDSVDVSGVLMLDGEAPTNNNTLYTLSEAEHVAYVHCLSRCLSSLHYPRSDIGYVLSYLKKNCMVSPYIYVHAYFLNDFTNAFSIAFDLFINAKDRSRSEIGYKLLLFLLSCGEGKVYPRIDDYFNQIPYALLIDLIEFICTCNKTLDIEGIDSEVKPKVDKDVTGTVPPPIGSSEIVMKSGSKKAYLSAHKYPYLAPLAGIDAYALFHCLSKCFEAVLLEHQGYQNTILLSVGRYSSVSTAEATYVSGISGHVTSVATGESVDSTCTAPFTVDIYGSSSSSNNVASGVDLVGENATTRANSNVQSKHSEQITSYFKHHSSIGEMYVTLYAFARYMDNSQATTSNGNITPGANEVGSVDPSLYTATGPCVPAFMEQFISQLCACRYVCFPTELLTMIIKEFSYKNIKPKSKLEDFMVLLARNQTIAACSVPSENPDDVEAASGASVAASDEIEDMKYVQMDTILESIGSLRCTFESIKIWRASATLLIALSSFISSTVRHYTEVTSGVDAAHYGDANSTEVTLLLSPGFRKLLQLQCSFYAQTHFDKAISSYITERADLQYKQRVFVFINETFEALFEAYEVSTNAVALVMGILDSKRNYKSPTHYVDLPPHPMHRMFGDACGKILLLLMNTDAVATKQIIAKWLLHSYHITQLLEQTKKFPLVQLDIMNHIVATVDAKQDMNPGQNPSNEDNEDRLSAVFNPSQMLHYIRLLSIHEPGSVLGFFLKHADDFPIDESLIITQEHHILDATAYLFERLGEPFKACDLLLQEVSSRMIKIKKEFDSEVKTPVKTYKVPLKKILMMHNSDPYKSSCVRELEAYDYLMKTIHLLSELCSRHTRKHSGFSNNYDAQNVTESLWFKTFDQLMWERQNQRSGLVTSAAELVTVLLTNILQDFMTFMRDFVPPQEIVRRVISNNDLYSSSNSSAGSGSTLGEFKEVITSMVVADVQEMLLSDTVKNIVKQDLIALSRSKGNYMRRGKRHEEVTRQQLLLIQNKSRVPDGLDRDSDSEETQSAVRSLPVPTRPVPVVEIFKEQPINRREKVNALKKRMSMDLLKVADLNCKLPCKETVADASVAIIPRKPGSLPVTAMNVCEYNGIMMD